MRSLNELLVGEVVMGPRDGTPSSETPKRFLPVASQALSVMLGARLSLPLTRQPPWVLVKLPTRALGGCRPPCRPGPVRPVLLSDANNKC